MITKSIIFDRDGIINKIVKRKGKPGSPRKKNEFIFHNEIFEIIKILKKKKYKIFVFTNQPDLARGQLSEENHKYFIDLIYEKLEVDDLFFCPHDDNDNCQCRKPKPGMLIKIEKKWNISRSNSIVIGDTLKDIDAGKKFGSKTILVKRDYNHGVKADYEVNRLSDIIKVIEQI